ASIDTPLAINRASGAATFSNTIAAKNVVQVSAVGAGNSNFTLYDSVAAVRGTLSYNGSNGAITLSNQGQGLWVLDNIDNCTARPDASGNFLVTVGKGYQTGGGSWVALSDARIKTVEGDY